MPRKFVRGLPYTTSTNGRDIPIFMKLCYEFWAYCLNGTSPMLTVTAASNANPIQITTSLPHGLQTNQAIGIYGVQGNTAANGYFTVTVLTATTFQLNGAVGNGAYTAGGTITVPGGIPITPTNGLQGFFEGSSTLVVGNDGVTSAIGGTLTITSQQFNISMVGKYVTLWAQQASTTMTAAMSGQVLPQPAIAVNSTTNFPPSGTLFVATSAGTQQVTYSAISGNSFIGCLGGTGTLSSGGFVTVQGTSSDDSVYRIIGFTSNNQIQVVPYTGGTPDISTLKPNLTSRSFLNYRVVDIVAASQLGVASGNFFVGNMYGSSNINNNGFTYQVSTTSGNLVSPISVTTTTTNTLVTGQIVTIQGVGGNTNANGNFIITVTNNTTFTLNGTTGNGAFTSGGSVTATNVPQFQWILRGSSATFGQFGIVGSPNGSWTGSTFTSAVGSSATLTERDTATSNSMSGGTANVTGFMTLIADTDFFLGHIRSSNSNYSGGYSFAILTPLRLYTQAQDPNPMCVLVNFNNLATSTGTDSYSNSIGMVGFDGTTRAQQLMTRNLAGDTANASIGNSYTVGPNLSALLMSQTRTGQFLYGDALITSTSTAGQFYVSRSKLRTVAFTSSALSQFQIVGNSGEFIHMGNGLLWPWDSSILPYSLLPLGT